MLSAFPSNIICNGVQRVISVGHIRLSCMRCTSGLIWFMGVLLIRTWGMECGRYPRSAGNENQRRMMTCRLTTPGASATGDTLRDVPIIKTRSTRSLSSSNARSKSFASFSPKNVMSGCALSRDVNEPFYERLGGRGPS